MGIKFLCPNGHKLNVKTFLAGKRAICPKCQARVIVPMSSAGADNEPAGGSTILTSEDMAAAGIPPVGPVSVVGTAAGAASVPVETVTALASEHSRAFDPIAEAPSAVWYVRPASGGQFGPASGDIMRSWIQEGRVGASSLVWRAGWSDWRQATATFPQLAALAAPPGGVAVSAGAGANGASVVPVAALVASASVPVADRTAGAGVPEVTGPLVPPVRRRQREIDSNLVASGVLIVIILVLLVVLALVFMRKDTTAQQESPEVAPARDVMSE